MNVQHTQQVIEVIKQLIASELNISTDKIKDNDTFFELGLDSISAIYLMELAENQLNIKLTPLDFWDFPTVEQFAEHIFNENFSA